MKTFFSIVLFLCCLTVQAQQKMRILFVPLDDRPPCLQFTERMGQIGGAEVVSPPKELLGRFMDFGQSDRINAWIAQQDLKRFDAAILCLDMMSYGGLVGSRVFQTSEKEALKRLDIVREIRKKNPAIRIYAQNVIMRLAPTADGKNEAYRQKLADWAEVCVIPSKKEETAALEKAIPAEALQQYKDARRRNLAVNLKVVDLVKNGTIHYLILSQDDAKPVGIHVADRERLVAEVAKYKLGAKIAVQPGTDEVSMLLLARTLNDYHRYTPTVKAVYSSAEMAAKTMPFEDKPLSQTVSFHIRATGAREVADKAELYFYVYASRFEPGRAVSFAREIAEAVKAGKKVIVADIDPKGNVQGGDSLFTEALLKEGVLPALNGYASWNTAGNTIGTALPQGVVFGMAQKFLLGQAGYRAGVLSAQHWFLLHRVMDDYYFHNVVRARANRYLRQVNRSAYLMTDAQRADVERYCLEQLTPYFRRVTDAYFKSGNVSCDRPTGLRFQLPWNRTFEADIDFDLTCR